MRLKEARPEQHDKTRMHQASDEAAINALEIAKGLWEKSRMKTFSDQRLKQAKGWWNLGLASGSKNSLNPPAVGSGSYSLNFKILQSSTSANHAKARL